MRVRFVRFGRGPSAPVEHCSAVHRRRSGLLWTGSGAMFASALSIAGLYLPVHPAWLSILTDLAVIALASAGICVMLAAMQNPAPLRFPREYQLEEEQ